MLAAIGTFRTMCFSYLCGEPLGITMRRLQCRTIAVRSRRRFAEADTGQGHLPSNVLGIQ